MKQEYHIYYHYMNIMAIVIKSAKVLI